MASSRALDPSSAADAAALVARLERVPFSRWHLRARLIVGSATFFDAFDALSLAFVLPVLVRLWQITPAQVGWLIATGYLGQFVGALVFGGLAERYGRVRSVAAATALMSAMSIACAASGSFATLLTLRLIQGIGVGGEMPVAAVYINELSKAHGRGRFFLLYELIPDPRSAGSRIPDPRPAHPPACAPRALAHSHACAGSQTAIWRGFSTDPVGQPNC